MLKADRDHSPRTTDPSFRDARKPDGEASASARDAFALQSDSSPMQVDDLAADGQSQAGAGGSGRPAGAPSEETAEDHRLFFRRDSRAVVGDFRRHPPSVGAGFGAGPEGDPS